ncbi:MAG: sensor histidine kinase, partial [Kiloniellales bacterium]
MLGALKLSRKSASSAHDGGAEAATDPRGLKVPLPILFMLLMLLVVISVFDILKKSYDVHSEANRRVATAILENTLTRATSGLNGIAARVAARDPDLSAGLPDIALASETADPRDLSDRALVLRFDATQDIGEARLGGRLLDPTVVARLAAQPALAQLFAAPDSAGHLSAPRIVLVDGIPYILSEPRGVTAEGEPAAFVAIGLPVRELIFDELEKYEVFRSGDLKEYLERQDDFSGLAQLIVGLQNREYAQFHFSAVAQIVVVLVAFVIAVMIGHHVDAASDALRQSRDVIAERERDAHRLRQLAERASHAKSQFIHNMSHELRTPLNAILGYAELIENETFGKLTGPQERYKEYAGSIHRGGMRLLNEVSQVLEYAALVDGDARGRDEPIELGALLQALAADFRELRTLRGVTLEVAAPEALPRLSADREMIAGLFRHLIANAIEFSPDNGRVTVSLAETADNRLAVAVHDRGAGMDERLVSQAFDPFEHGEDAFSRKHQGMGLGLSL